MVCGGLKVIRKPIQCIATKCLSAGKFQILISPSSVADVLFIPFTRVPAVEQANRSFLHSVYFRPFRSPRYFHVNGITRMSPGNQFKSPYSYRSKPLGLFVQSPDFTTATSSPPWQFITLPARLFVFFFKYTIAEMKATSKLGPPHPSA